MFFLRTCYPFFTLSEKEEILNECLILFGMLFQTTGLEYEMLSLYKAKLCFGIVKFSYVMDLKEMFCAISDLRLNISLIYCGTKPFATLNITLALFRNTLCSKESILMTILHFQN